MSLKKTNRRRSRQVEKRADRSTALEMKSQRAGEKRPPTIEALRALVAFADEGHSISKAARRLRSQQPVVSVKLKVFQEESNAAGAILLNRDSKGRGLALTDAGKAALPAVRELVRQYDQLLEHLRGDADSPVALKLAVGAFSAEHFVPRALAELRKSCMDSACVVKTYVVRGRERIVGVATGVYDLAIVSHTREQANQTLRESGIDDSLVISPLAGLPLVLLAGKQTSEARLLASIPEQQPVPLNLLSQFELAGPDAQSGVRRQLEVTAGDNVRLTFVAEGGGWAAAREFARYGLGVAIVPRACLSRSDQSQFVCRPLANSFRLRHFLVQRQRESGAGHEQLVAAIRNAAGETAGHSDG